MPVTTNFVLGAWVPVDQWSWAEEVDVVAIDHYPSTPDLAEEETAFAADLARGWAGGRPWLLMEQAPNLIHSGGRMIVKDPGRMTRLSLSHVARGSRGAMFFQWRAPRGGAERLHSAMVPHPGPDTRVFEEVVELGATLHRIAAVDAGRVEASVAITWDSQSWWALQGPGLPADVDYAEAVRGVHAALWRSGVTADVVRPGADLSAYRLVLVPALYLVSDDAARSIRSYVDEGGSLAVSFLSGVADPDNQIRVGGYAGAFRDVLGVRVDELHPLPDGATVNLTGGYTGREWAELVRTEGAEVVAEYASGTLAGHPAITRHRFGAGLAWYISTRLDDDALRHLVGELMAASGVLPVSAKPVAGVELVRRCAGARRWLIAINHTTRAHDVVATGDDLVSGERVDGALTLRPGGHAVVREGTGRRKTMPVDGLSNGKPLP